MEYRPNGYHDWPNLRILYDHMPSIPCKSSINRISVSFVFCHANIALDFSENNKQWDPKKSSSGPHMQNC